MSINFGGSGTSQVLAELILQYSALSFCSSKGGKKKGKKNASSVGLAVAVHSQCLGFQDFYLE
jgi:hypothetical protein